MVDFSLIEFLLGLIVVAFVITATVLLCIFFVIRDHVGYMFEYSATQSWHRGHAAGKQIALDAISVRYDRLEAFYKRVCSDLYEVEKRKFFEDFKDLERNAVPTRQFRGTDLDARVDELNAKFPKR